MDLNRMGLPELVREAERLGLPHPHGMSRAKLIRSIKLARARIAVPKLAIRMAGTVLGGVVGLARSALAPPVRALLEGRAPVEPKGSAPDRRETVFRGPSRTQEAQKRPDAAPPAAPMTIPVPPPPGTADAARKTATGEPNGPRAPASLSPDAPGNEPIKTRTMARLLAEQGYFRRALAIYDRLLGEHPGDAELTSEAETVRARVREKLSSTADASSTKGDDEGEMVSIAVDTGTVLVSWQVSEAAVERTRQTLGGDALLSVRVVVTAPDAERVIGSQTRQRSAVPPSGEWVLSSLPQNARATASVGLSAGSRFVSIAHAAPVRAG